jgi:hypothetical protein
MNDKLLASAAMLAIASSTFAGSHLWDFTEVFSSPDGQIQFIELHVATMANFETQLAGKKVSSLATGKSFTFPVNLTPPTGQKYLLLATSAFAALPGSPTPDFIIPANFFGTSGDTLTYHVYDSWVIGATAVPLDCVSSLKRNGSISANTPKNYAGVQGTVDACPAPPCPADIDDSGVVDAGDIAVLLGAWGSARSEADLDGDNDVDAADLSVLLGAWGDCG